MAPFSVLTVTIAVFVTQFGHHKCGTIDTSSPNEFYGGQINCSSTENCTVICDEQDSCTEATIYCPRNYSCGIHCAGRELPYSMEGACQGATVHCPTEGTCTINCGGDYSCEDIVFKVLFPGPLFNRFPEWINTNR
eukprot:391037_1